MDRGLKDDIVSFKKSKDSKQNIRDKKKKKRKRKRRDYKFMLQ